MREKLPGNVRERIGDLMRQKDVTQAALAREIECAESTFSRFMSEKTDSLSYESIIRLAEYFDVSTDYLLGVTDIPDRERFEIDELGLTFEAAKELYVGRMDKKVINDMLARQDFGDLTYYIGDWLRGDAEAEVAAAIQIRRAVMGFSEQVLPKKQASIARRIKHDLDHSILPSNLVDRTQIGKDFSDILTGMRQDTKTERAEQIAKKQAFTKEAMRQFFAGLVKDAEVPMPNMTRSQYAKQMTKALSEMSGARIQDLAGLETAVYSMIQEIPGKEAK